MIAVAYRWSHGHLDPVGGLPFHVSSRYISVCMSVVLPGVCVKTLMWFMPVLSNWRSCSNHCQGWCEAAWGYIGLGLVARCKNEHLSTPFRAAFWRRHFWQHYWCHRDVRIARSSHRPWWGWHWQFQIIHTGPIATYSMILLGSHSRLRQIYLSCINEEACCQALTIMTFIISEDFDCDRGGNWSSGEISSSGKLDMLFSISTIMYYGYMLLCGGQNETKLKPWILQKCLNCIFWGRSFSKPPLVSIGDAQEIVEKLALFGAGDEVVGTKASINKAHVLDCSIEITLVHFSWRSFPQLNPPNNCVLKSWLPSSRNTFVLSLSSTSLIHLRFDFANCAEGSQLSPTF